MSLCTMSIEMVGQIENELCLRGVLLRVLLFWHRIMLMIGMQCEICVVGYQCCVRRVEMVAEFESMRRE